MERHCWRFGTRASTWTARGRMPPTANRLPLGAFQDTCFRGLPPRRRVFIVDDDALMLRAFERVLRLEGFVVDTFTSAFDFLRSLPSHVPCCLILDLNMPGLDGLSLQKTMRQASLRTPIIFVSGRADVASTASAMRHGAVDFLEKPVDTTRLLDAVARALEQDAAQRSHQDDVMRARPDDAADRA